MKKTIPLFLVLALTFAFSSPSNSEVVDVAIKGFDDGIKTTKQQDYKEALLFAKIQAIERAGIKIKAKTLIKDLILQEDYIEFKAEGILLPGYRIVDIGYTEDGSYHVVLLGQIDIKDRPPKKGKATEQKTEKDIQPTRKAPQKTPKQPKLKPKEKKKADVLGLGKITWHMKPEEVSELLNLDASKIWHLYNGDTIINLDENDDKIPIALIHRLFFDKDDGLTAVIQKLEISNPKKFKACADILSNFEKLKDGLISKYGSPIFKKANDPKSKMIWEFPSTIIILTYSASALRCTSKLEYYPNER
jgi:hypothetical protein